MDLRILYFAWDIKEIRLGRFGTEVKDKFDRDKISYHWLSISREILMSKTLSMERIITSLAKRFKQIGFAGTLRFRLLMLAYTLFPYYGDRSVEWRFVLNYLPSVSKIRRDVYVLDIGSTTSLFIYELASRKYKTYAIDFRPYQERLPKNITFVQCDTRNIPFTDESFDYVTAISTIEHIGLGSYGDPNYDEGDKKTIKEIWRTLKKNGRFLVTTPNEIYAYGGDLRGYSHRSFKDLMCDYFTIEEITERKGQICAMLVRK